MPHYKTFYYRTFALPVALVASFFFLKIAPRALYILYAVATASIAAIDIIRYDLRPLDISCR